MRHRLTTLEPSAARRDAARPAPARRRAKFSLLRLISTLCAAAAVSLAVAPVASSQDPVQPTPPPTPAPTATPTPTPSPTPSPTPAPRVLKAYKLGDPQETEAGLNDIVVLEVANLRGMLDRSNCLNPDGTKEANCDPSKRRILLYIDGRPLKGIEPESGAPELRDGTNNGTLRYHLRRPVKSDAVSTGDVLDTQEHWADLLGLGYNELIGVGSLWRRDASISVGVMGEDAIATDVKGGNFRLLRVRPWRFLFWIALLGGFVYLFWRLAREGDIIRDRKPVAWRHGRPQRKAYSLSRTQIAWWTFFVAFGFIFIWLVTGQYDLSPSALVLLGISVVTTIGSSVIDGNRSYTSRVYSDDVIAPPADDLAALLHEKEDMEQQMAAVRRQIALGQATREDLEALLPAYNRKIADIKRRFPDALGFGNERFDIDILSDANGISIHRFQMALWTVVLGFIFVHEVLARLAMPQFSPTLLLLLGISNGTYLLGKSAEPQTPPTPGAAADSPTGSPPDSPP